MKQQISPMPYANYNSNKAYARHEQRVMVDFISTSRQPSRLEQAISDRQIENQSCVDELMMLNQQLTPKAMASRDAAQRTRAVLYQAQLVRKTESTRPKRFAIRGGQMTVEALKSREEIEMETKAQKQAASMLSDALYSYNNNAGLAGFSPREIANNCRTSSTMLAPIV